VEIKKLLDDVKYWIMHETYPMDEIAARFHHRLVLIHPFPNGNGRWARVMADCLLFSLDHEPFSWGMKTDKKALSTHGEVRSRYIRALRLADGKNHSELLAFVRS
jgi:Fic-DOC domain mobile mystery protein B